MNRGLALAVAAILLVRPAYAQMDADFSLGGAARIGWSTTTCNAGAAGALRYNSTSGGRIDFCNGTAWANVGSSGAATPDRGIQFNSGGSFAANSNLVYSAAGNLGVRSTAPMAPLHVGGEAILGTSTGLACDVNREGGLRYNTTSDCLELCNGTSWACISVAACGDATPNGFDFNDLVNQSTSTLVSSNILQIAGLACVVNVAVSGEGSPQYRTCSDSGCSTVLTDWTSTTGTIANNAYLQLRLTTSAAGGDTYSATVSVGTGADVWNATPTGDCSGSPAPGTVCADGTVYAGLSPDGNVKMYVTRCDAGQSWNGTACTGTRLSLSWNNGGGGFVTTGYTSSITGEANTTGVAALDSDSGAGGFQDHVAAVYCNSLSQDGQTDWYLPARTELDVIYGNNGVIANFSTGGSWYWCSSENDTSRGWRKRFSDGAYEANGAGKESANFVRCARR